MIKVVATPIPPFDWPMNTDPTFEDKTSDVYVDELAPTNIIPSLWSSSPCAFNMVFSGNVVTPDDITVSNVELVSGPEDQPFLTLTKTNSTTYKVEGTTNSLPGEYYDFKLRDNTVIQLPPVNTADWSVVTKWNPPPRPWEHVLTYEFNVTYSGVVDGIPIASQTTLFSVIQYSYWKWEIGLATLKNLVSIGEF